MCENWPTSAVTDFDALTGREWIDTGTLMERLNFATQQLGDANNPGVNNMIERIAAGSSDSISPERLVERCLDEMGMISVSEETRATLEEFASQLGDLELGPELDERSRQTLAQMLQMVAATHEFQRA